MDQGEKKPDTEKLSEEARVSEERVESEDTPDTEELARESEERVESEDTPDTEELTEEELCYPTAGESEEKVDSDETPVPSEKELYEAKKVEQEEKGLEHDMEIADKGNIPYKSVNVHSKQLYSEE
ncbi:hypothetical protein AWC38_SpisGene23503 [Stylophora pistillata]|uniref:Uncharacterized protein n=1 Tax=Stylophora pistillata TaxID=50429 RepID=A0A2B4R6T7_STYPI|nr:hypothetical protein AWC38_SpisGene23503 [Stylophora pistillata]